MKYRKRIASIIATITIGATMVCGSCISANAASGSISINSSSATLKNNTNNSRYGVIRFQVIDRETGKTVKSANNNGVLSPYSSITASASGYSTITYRFYGYGTLYNGTSAQSGSYWSGNATY